MITEKAVLTMEISSEFEQDVQDIEDAIGHAKDMGLINHVQAEKLSAILSSVESSSYESHAEAKTVMRNAMNDLDWTIEEFYDSMIPEDADASDDDVHMGTAFAGMGEALYDTQNSELSQEDWEEQTGKFFSSAIVSIHSVAFKNYKAEPVAINQ